VIDQQEDHAMQRTLTTTAALVLGLAGLTAAPLRADEALNRKVLKFAEERLGKKVGDGECWTLADEALGAAGAHRPGRGGYGSFVFGKAVDRKELTPGDVIQFSKVRIERRGAGGVVAWSDVYQHTAIVEKVQGSRVTLLHQNYNGQRTVSRLTFDLNDVRRGTLSFYRPEPR
jgi:hypothetical protein